MLTAPLTADGEVRLDERDPAVRDRLDGVLVDVDPDDLDSAGGQRHRGGQPDVAQTDDGDAAVEHLTHAVSPIGSAMDGVVGTAACTEALAHSRPTKAVLVTR